MSKPIRVVFLGLLALTSIGLGLWFGNKASAPDPASGYTHMGGDFTLQSATGPVSLADYRGKVVAIYFGYTHCPDVCPTSLAALAQAFNRLSDEERAQMRGIFISVDPERDTPEIATKYAQAFHPSFSGLSGTPEAIAEVAKRYFVLYEKVEMDDSAMEYAIDHSSILYVLGKNGIVQSLVRHSESQEDLLKSLRAALAG